MANRPDRDLVEVAPLSALREAGVLVISVPSGRVAVFSDPASGEVFAVDNRCPHMGFPLQRGTVQDGILTCHWHQARFDLRSGCTFDLWADDVPRYEVAILDEAVYVSPVPSRKLDTEAQLRRLRRGLEQNVSLVLARALLALLEDGASIEVIAGEVVSFAGKSLPSFGEGLERLACVVNLYPYLSRDTAYQALLYAIRAIAEEASRAVPRRGREALDSEEHSLETLEGWLRQWTRNRHQDAAERTVLTALHQRMPDAELAHLVFGAAGERLYADTGHLFDFTNKCFELVELLGRDYGRPLWPLLMFQLTQARGEEENTDWHHPIEIVEPLATLEHELPELIEKGRAQHWTEADGLTDVLLGDDPLAILSSLGEALRSGAPPVELAKRVAYTAALRLARFATSNEVTDWITCQHVMNFANAVERAVERSPTPEVVRAVFQAAIAVYQVRYLNVPPARLPSERRRSNGLPDDASSLRRALLEVLNGRGSLEHAAQLVSHYLRRGHPFDDLVDTLTLATVREDLDFHTLQVLEAGVHQATLWEGRPEAEHILVGVIRSLAAQCPTRRAGQQTATIAQRLHRGDNIYEEE